MARKGKPKNPDAKNPYKKESSLDKQVMDGDTITIADCKDFIEDGKVGQRADFINVADRSWNEIEKRNKKGRLYGGNDLDKARRWTKFPLWWTCLQVRRPITFARLPVPVLKDTQGDDPFGRTACVIGERFIRGILKTFDVFPEFESCNDDFLVTNFGFGRWFYRKTECVEEEKLRLVMLEQEPPPPIIGPDGQPMAEEAPPEPLPPIFQTPDGEVVENPLEDEFGPYMLTGEEAIIESEEVYFESGLYSNLYVEAGVRKWNAVTKLAFEYQYSYREFKEKFGEDALKKLSIADIEDHRKNGKPIICFEYHDKLLKECRYFAENSEDFFQPLELEAYDQRPKKEQKKGGYDNSDLYGLSGFFPCTKPLLINAPTKEFWPTPEFFQVQDLIDNVHNIVSRLILLTKAIKVRFFFDSSLPQLNMLIGETGEATGIGIPNLEQSLMNNKGQLTNLVAYFPVKELIEGLQNMYGAFEQGLNMFYQATGLSELVRGQTSNEVEKTYGERQLEGKFALNRMEPFQRKLQEWIKDNFQLGMEMGFKLFSETTVDEYITPQTLDQEDKERYLPALELLKNNKRARFRVDFETDSTIAINEQWRRGQAIETANVITKMQESIAKTAETMPELAESQLKIMQHVVSELTDGKLFLDEITDSIEKVIEKVQQPKEPEPNIDQMKIQLETQKAQNQLGKDQAEFKFRQIEHKATQQLEFAKLQQKAQQDSIVSQLKQIEMQIASGASQQDMQLAVNKLQADIAQGWEELNLKKQALILAAQQEGGKMNLAQFTAQIDARVKAQEMTLAEAAQALEAFKVQLEAKDHESSLQERWATERRLQEEHGVNVEATKADAAANLMQAMKVEPPKAAPISIDLSKTVQIKEGNKTEKKKEPKK